METAYNKFGPTATPIILSKITIEGNGATLQWQGTFTLGIHGCLQSASGRPDLGSGTGDLTLRNVYIKDFHIKGGTAVMAAAEAWARVAQFIMRVIS